MKIVYFTFCLLCISITLFNPLFSQIHRSQPPRNQSERKIYYLRQNCVLSSDHDSDEHDGQDNINDGETYIAHDPVQFLFREGFVNLFENHLHDKARYKWRKACISSTRSS